MVFFQEDLEVDASDPEKSKNILAKLDSIMLNSNLAKQMQTLIGDYLLLERYYVEQSIKKALTMDTFDKDALVSSMVDDMFFIVKKSIR